MFGLTPFFRREKALERAFEPFVWPEVFENFFNNSLLPSFFLDNSPRINIRENEKEYVVEAELPGVKKDEINLTLQDNVLTLEVDHNEEINVENERYIRRERRYGKMRRAFPLDIVEEEKISAKFENGVLYLVLPKKNPVINSGKRIEIQ